ncbi:MAG TPA: caspase family protein [Opitutaceae bacterium]
MGTPRYRALLIGNARFDRDPHNLPALVGPPEDLKLLERALADPETGLHETANVRALLDGTNSEVREAIDDFFHGATPDDQLILYYSGHGRQDSNNSLFLCTRDTRTDRLVSTSVSDVDINQMSLNSHAARTLIILDCCHSGSFKGGGLPPALVQASGRFVLTSCRNHQLATDAHVVGGASAFTSHLVQALLSTEVDTNHDGFVTLSEVYHEILPKLNQATRQIPQLHLDKTVGDPPLCRARKKEHPVGGDRTQPATARPVLAVSDTKIALEGVQLGEALPAVMIDVFNEGDGELDWTATTEDPWIAIHPEPRFFRLRFDVPKPGSYRGNVYVRDSGRGGSKRISVYVQVLEPAVRPEISVAESAVDFGTVRVGSKVSPQVVAITNKGSGELRASARSSNPLLRVSVTDRALTIDPDLSRAGSLSGEIEITSAGGSAVVLVRGAVEAGPVLGIKPGKILDFGRLPADVLKWKKLKIVNEGSGELEWEFQTDGDFFSVEHEGEMELKVSVAGNPPGDYLGTILIKSNGGEATINVRAHIDPARNAVPPPLPVAVIDLSGWWQNPNGRILVTGQAPEFQYADYNAFGIQVGGGRIRLDGNQVFIEGSSLMIPYTGQLVMNGPVLSGAISFLGTQNPVVYTRC